MASIDNASNIFQQTAASVKPSMIALDSSSAEALRSALFTAPSRKDEATPKNNGGYSEGASTGTDSDNASDAGADGWASPETQSPTSTWRWADVDLEEIDYDWTRPCCPPQNTEPSKPTEPTKPVMRAEQPPPPPVLDVTRPARQALRTKLSSGARMWQPACVAVAAPPAPAKEDVFIMDYEQQVADIVYKVMDAIVANHVCSEVTLASSRVHEGKSRQSWAVIAKVRSGELMQHMAFLLELAREVVLSAAEQSESTCVSGYNNEPFETRPQGFTATLCGMREESQACWDVFAEGVCRRGPSCRWQHPAAFSRVAVIVIAE